MRVTATPGLRLAAEALHIRRRWRRNRVESASPFATAGHYGTGHGLFKIASFVFACSTRLLPKSPSSADNSPATA